jgi:tRNA modification GTPase
MAGPDTIFALSSGRLPAAVAVVRVSGPQVRFVIETLFGRIPGARQMTFGSFRESCGGLIDQGLVVFFAAPSSFTGEDCAEFHVHGSVAVVRALSSVLSSMEGVRHAEPGEFTRRAFLNGKLDLAQAEGLGDLISAETEAQRRLALMQADGGLSSVYEDWRSRILHARAMVEAAIDFSDEDDVADRAFADANERLVGLLMAIRRHLAGYRLSEIIREGFSVVILGAPNSGKSTLLNAFAGREVAITTDEPGTTRDLIDVRLDLSGNLVVVTDTAGIRENAGKAESIGIARARRRAADANLILLLEDVCEPIPIEIDVGSIPVLNVGNKADQALNATPGYDYVISARTGDGVAELLAEVGGRAADVTRSTEIFAVHDRHCQLLFSAAAEIEAASNSASHLDLCAEHLRRASDLIGRLTGRVEVEELLGVIFSKFCIGK